MTETFLATQQVEDLTRPSKRPKTAMPSPPSTNSAPATGRCAFRALLLPHALADRLEARRLDAPQRVVDRGVRYPQRYDLGGGHAFSASFSRASVEALGKSRGAHGLRHRFAQERMRELMHHAEHRLALAIVSEEMGHLRPEITLVYCV